MKLTFVYKGGKGSGFRGHAGIPGHQGGSSSNAVETINPNGRKKPAAKGLYTAAHIPVIDSLSYNVFRETLAINARKGLDTILNRHGLKGKIIGVQIVGSFLSDKEEPKDLDLLIEFTDKQSLMHYLTNVYPATRFSFGRVEFMGWSKDRGGEETKDTYLAETKKRYGVDPIDVSAWLDV